MQKIRIFANFSIKIGGSNILFQFLQEMHLRRRDEVPGYLHTMTKVGNLGK